MQKEIRNKWWILISCALVGFFLDWLTKSSAARLLQEGEPVRLLGDYLELVLVYNKGAIFGLDPRHLIPGFPVNLFFAVFMSLAIVLLIVYFARLRKNEIGMHWGLAL
ncbi:MAG: signal peptidase II, partial [Chitinispirillaceae bacterium]|nr:signal peptidase II [Chitinispirillaceae bacterium]